MFHADIGRQRQVYATSIYISLLYIKKDMSVCLSVPSFWPNPRVNFSETRHDDRF